MKFLFSLLLITFILFFFLSVYFPPIHSSYIPFHSTFLLVLPLLAWTYLTFPLLTLPRYLSLPFLPLPSLTFLSLFYSVVFHSPFTCIPPSVSFSFHISFSSLTKISRLFTCERHMEVEQFYKWNFHFTYETGTFSIYEIPQSHVK